MKEKKFGILPKLYLCWAVLAISITFLSGGFSNDNITHIIILIILILSLIIFKFLKWKNPKVFFIFSCVILAALAEGAYMISKPVLPSLLVGRDFALGQFMQNYAIDLLLTVPVYFFIFWVIWKLINKFNYSKWEYIFLMAFGQAIGDGSSFFFVQPAFLLLIPYIMLNYHAMNVAPFLSIQSYLKDKQKSNSRWKYVITILVLFATYFLGGTAIKVFAKLLNLN